MISSRLYIYIYLVWTFELSFQITQTVNCKFGPASRCQILYDLERSHVVGDLLSSNHCFNMTSPSRTPLYTRTDEFFWQISFTRGELVRWSCNKSTKDEPPSRSWWCIPCPHGESCQLQKHPEMHLGIGHLRCLNHSPQCPTTCGPALQPIWSAHLSREQTVANCWRPQRFFLWKPLSCALSSMNNTKFASVCPCFMAILPHQRMCFQELQYVDWNSNVP